MAKRFLDTDLFRKPFMRSLEAPYKALWIYLLCECDHAGLWVVELDVAQMRMGLKLDPEKVIEKMGGAVVPVGNGSTWYLPDFVAFQYGTLNPSNRVHSSVLDRLLKYGIDPNDTSQNKPLASPLEGAKDKDKDKDTQVRKERATEVDRVAVAFDALWITFERYGSKAKALAYYRKLSQDDRDAVHAKAAEYVASTPGCEYRKQLEGWINPDNRLWERPIPKRSVVPTGPLSKEEARARLDQIRIDNNIEKGGVVPVSLMPKEVKDVIWR